VVTVVGVDAKLADDFESVLAPVADVDERVVERGPVVAREAVAIAERVGGGEDVGGDDFVEETLELGSGVLVHVGRKAAMRHTRLRSSSVVAAPTPPTRPGRLETARIPA